MALLTLDNGIQVMLRRSDVPPDVQAYIKYRADREVENLRKMMKQEGFQPDLAPPATQPSPPPTQAGGAAGVPGAGGPGAAGGGKPKP